MKKKLFSVIFLCLLCVLLPVTSFAVEDNSSENNHIDIDYSMAAIDRYFAFVYNEEAWLNEYLGENECIPGYLYVEDKYTEEIRLLTTESVKILRDTPNAVFCVMTDERIVQMDYSGQSMETIYQASRGDITYCERLDNQLCFVEGDYIICLDLTTLGVHVVLEHENITQAFLHTADLIIWREGSAQYYLYNRTTNMNTPLSEYELRDMTSTSITELTGLDMDLYSTQTTLENFPFSDFPSGTSYFTNNGSACTDHNDPNVSHLAGTCNCRRYARAAQCWGFALYASDRYAHISGTETSRPSTASGDWKSTTTFTSNAQMQSYFSNFSKGAYIRLSKTSTSGDGNHSVVFVSASSTGITVYDCNYNGPCLVTLRTISYYDLRTIYPYVCSAFSHSFTGTVTYISSNAHAVYCSSSGCQGYILQPHVYKLAGGTTCTICGFLNNSVEDEAES